MKRKYSFIRKIKAFFLKNERFYADPKNSEVLQIIININKFNLG